MTVEEKAYNYASKLVKNRLTASEVAAHYGRGYIEGQEDMKHYGWHPASELPPVDKNGNSKLMVVIDDNGLSNYAYFHSDNLAKFWVKAGDWNMQQPILSVKWWCYPPNEE